MVFSRLKRWFLLRKAKKEEKKHIPTVKEIEKEHKEFIKQAEDLSKELEK